MDDTATLVRAIRLSPDEVRHRPIPVVLRGYDRRAVDLLRAQVAADLDTQNKALIERQTVEEELRAEIRRLTEKMDEAGELASPLAPAADQGNHAASVLNLAQRQADQLTGNARKSAERMLDDARQQAEQIIAQARQQADHVVAQAQQHAQKVVGGAQHEAGQLVEHAQQQAGTLMTQAQHEAASERTRIIGDAAGAAREVVDKLNALAASMKTGLREDVERVMLQMGDWDEQLGKI